MSRDLANDRNQDPKNKSWKLVKTIRWFRFSKVGYIFRSLFNQKSSNSRHRSPPSGRKVRTDGLHFLNKVLLAPQKQNNGGKRFVKVTTSLLVHLLHNDVYLMQQTPHSHEVWLHNVLDPCHNSRKTPGQFAAPSVEQPISLSFHKGQTASNSFSNIANVAKPVCRPANGRVSR